MCLKSCVSVVLYLVCICAQSEGFFLPVFVRKQHAQTPVVNNAQWTSYQPAGSLTPLSASSANGNLNVNGIGGNGAHLQLPHSHAYKEYNPFPQTQEVVTPQHQVPLPQAYNQGYAFDTGNPPYQHLPYPQYQSAFHSVQLVPCLCPISKDIIDQQVQHFHSSSATSSSSSLSASPVESGNNDLSVKGSKKVNS